jgi:hypothetical protein
MQSHTLWSKVTAIFDPLNLEKCDAFEETLLELAGVKTQPTVCHTNPYIEASYVILALGINTEDSAIFLDYYKKNYDGLKIENVTEAYKKLPDRVEFTTMNNKPTQVFVIEFDGLITKILPAIAAHIKEHPEKIENYLRLSYPSFPSSASMIRTLFAEQKKETDTTDCFEESLTAIAQHHAAYTDALLSCLFPSETPMLPLLKIICSYLDSNLQIEELSKETIAEIAFPPRKNRFRDSKEFKESLEILMLTEEGIPQSICNYFNRLVPRSAFFIDNAEKWTGVKTPLKKIVVENRAIHHPTFVEELKRADYLQAFRHSYIQHLLLAAKQIEDYHPAIKKVYFSQAYVPLQKMTLENCDQQQMDTLFAKAKSEVAEKDLQVKNLLDTINELTTRIQKDGLHDTDILLDLCLKVKTYHASYKRALMTTKVSTKRARDADETRTQVKAKHLDVINEILVDIAKIEEHLFAVHSELEPKAENPQQIVVLR